jgi:hypothetical protein
LQHILHGVTKGFGQRRRGLHGPKAQHSARELANAREEPQNCAAMKRVWIFSSMLKKVVSLS